MTEAERGSDSSKSQERLNFTWDAGHNMLWSWFVDSTPPVLKLGSIRLAGPLCF